MMKRESILVELVNEGATAWHFLGPWTGYIIGIILAGGLLWLNNKV